MKCRNILLMFFLISIICLSIQSLSAENVTVDSYDNELNLSNEVIDVELDDSREVLSSYDESNLSEVSSDPLPNVETGVVSGGVDFTNTHPWAPSDAVNGNRGNITYKIPSAATNIKSAYIYVNVYSGSGGTNYGAYANTTLITANGERQLGSEYLWTSTSSPNGINYILNDHVTRCYSDYMIFYNVTDLLQGLNGTSLSVNVLSYPMMGKSFDGRIKLVSLFVAWDDGDLDEIYYWLNAGQAWTDDTQEGISHTFENIGDFNFSEKLSTLINVGISSTDALYTINGNTLFSQSDSDEYISGAYYQYHKWDVGQYIGPGTLELGYKAVGGAYNPSFKDLVSILLIQDTPAYVEDEAQISLIPEFTEIPSAYAGTNNTLTVKITTKEGRYAVKLLADGKTVNQTELDLDDGVNTLFLTDPTVRAVDDLTVNGIENNKKVNYTVEVSLNGKLINSSSVILPILYNGYLGKDLAYPKGGIEYFLNMTVNGDIVIDIQDYSHYISANVLNRTEVWDVDLDENSNIVRSFIYVPYYEFNSRTYDEDGNMFDVMFNDVNVVPVALYRDQSNLGLSYYSGYGILLYDVTGLVRSGRNYLQLNKKFDTPAVYPSALIYMFNTTQSSHIKEIYIYNGADLLEGISNNVAGRLVHTDTKMDVNSKLTSNATLHVFAAGPQSDEGNLIFNGEVHENIWNENSTSNGVYSLDITNSVRDTNSISFVATGSRIIALQQIIVLSKNSDDLNISLESEYPNTCFAGTNNYITVKIESVGNNKMVARLFADGEMVNESEIDLVYGLNEFRLLDPAIRTVDEFSVIGAENKKVNYTVQLLSGDKVMADCSINLNMLYNGYLGKDLAYPKGGIDSFLNITVNGDIVVDVKDYSSYLSDFDTKRTDVWNVNLDSNSKVVKAFVYVPYASFNVNFLQENASMFNVKFNDNAVDSIALYRDQSNLGQNGRYGYGLMVYDVTDLLKDGENSFELNKKQPTPKVYPSTLVYMYNTTSSVVLKHIYISNGADLLSKDSDRFVHINSTINVDSTTDIAKLYVFAANAQDGEGDIVFNGELHENVWNGTASSTDFYVLDISNGINKANNISFVVKEDAILALQQIIVTTQKAKTVLSGSAVTVVYNTNKNLVVTLKDSKGNAIANAKLTIVLNGKSKAVTTNSKGQATLAIPANLVPKTYTAKVSYAGDNNTLKSSASIKVVVKKATVKLAAKAKAFKVNVKTKKYVVTLKDNKNKAMKSKKLTLKVNGKTYSAKTNSKGQATFKITKLTKKGKFTVKISYAGDKYFNKLVKSVKITVKK